jgi:hypothetical protein
MKNIDNVLNKSIEDCMAAMAVGKVQMVFLKKNGTFRIALATRCPTLIPPNPHRSRRRRPPRPDVIPFYDLDKQAWRSMRREMFGGFTHVEPEADMDNDIEDDGDKDHPNLEAAYRGEDPNDIRVEQALRLSEK